MQHLHLLVEDDYIETFIDSLEKEKVVVIEKDFSQNQELLQSEFSNYKEKKLECKTYYASMKELSIWLKEKEQ
jgi:hypothetical protein